MTTAAEPVSAVRETLIRLPKDLRQATATLGRDEVRYLVDSYYQMQDFRKATANQVRALTEGEEPHATLGFFHGQFDMVESDIRKALDAYSASQKLGEWARQVIGIGPVIAAGLLGHIDIERARTAGAIWRFAGLDPSLEWKKGEKRPYNADLKVLCWKIGDSFVKVKGRDNAFYGKLYEQRKEFEIIRDAEGYNEECAKHTLETRNFRDKKVKAVYESGRIPLGRIELRARRYAVKMFLAHYHEEGWLQMGQKPPVPYALTMPDHVHPVPSPVPSLA